MHIDCAEHARTHRGCRFYRTQLKVDRTPSSGPDLTGSRFNGNVRRAGRRDGRGADAAVHREAAYAKYFIGQSYLAPLVSGKELNVSNVTFEAGCRNNWHIHHKACQILIAVGGRGYYQEWDKEPVALNPGDVVYVAPETKHWHGAAPDSDFAHIAIMNAVDGASNEWLEPVEAEYDALR